MDNEAMREKTEDKEGTWRNSLSKEIDRTDYGSTEIFSNLELIDVIPISFPRKNSLNMPEIPAVSS